MRIALNLATRPFADIGPAMKRLRIGMGVLALTAIALVLGLRALHQKAEAARERAHSLDGAIARISAERQGYIRMMEEPANAQLLVQTDGLNKLFDEKAFSWTLTMESLETVLPGGVQVSTLEPVREKDGHITLHMRVIGPRDLAVNFVRNLEHSKRFLLPRITGESAENNGAPGQQLEPVSDTNRFSFDLLADYNPPSPAEVKAARKRDAGNGKTTPEARGPQPPGHPGPARRVVPQRMPGRPPYTGNENVSKPNPAVYPAPGGPK